VEQVNTNILVVDDELGPRESILVVDDELGPRESMRMILKPYYNVITADNGETALNVIKENPIDIVILDLKMPGLNGLEVLKEIRNFSPDTETIIVTGYGTLNTATEAMKYGVANFVTKPFDVSDIISAVEKSIEKKRFNSKLNHFFREVLSEETTTSPEMVDQPGFSSQKTEETKKCEQEHTLKDFSGCLPFSEDLLDITEQRVKKIKELKNGFSHEVKTLEEKLIQAEKLATVGELSASFAHEVNNILCSIGGYAQFVQQKISKQHPGEISDIREDIEIIINQSERANKLIKNLLGFSRNKKSEESFVNVSTLIDRVLSFISYRLHNLNIEIIKEYEASLPEVFADPNKLEQVFLNLLVNAFHAMPQGGKIKITMRCVNNWGEDFLRVDLADTGCGIPEENLKKVFDPFFTTKERGAGTGLGLFICRRIIENYQGSLELRSKVGEGTTFTIKLPVAHSASSSKREEDSLYN
jgi:signal transduction histidine kinase/DNA-binding NarL/FixJ family response regulator